MLLKVREVEDCPDLVFTAISFSEHVKSKTQEQTQVRAAISLPGRLKEWSQVDVIIDSYLKWLSDTAICSKF